MTRKRDLAAAIKAFSSLGGKARAAALTSEQRKAIASKASKARWAHHQKKEAGRAVTFLMVAIAFAFLGFAIATVVFHVNEIHCYGFREDVSGPNE